MNTPSIPTDNPAFKYAISLLSALSESGRGLQDLLEIGYKVLENPILIADKSWRAIAMMPQAEIPEDSSWNEFLLNGFLSPNTIASSIKDMLVEKIDMSNTPFRWLSVDMKYPRLFGKIKLNGGTPALISVLEYNRPFCESDYILLEMLCNAAATEFLKNDYQQYARGTQHEDLFVNILEGRLNDPSSITERLKVLKLRLNKLLYIFVFDNFSSLSNQISITYLRDDIEKMIVDGKALIYNGRVVILAHFASDDGLSKVTAELNMFVEKFGLRCGISRVFEQLADLRTHYEQATNALSVGQHIEPHELIYHFSEYGIYHTVKVYLDSGWAESFIHPGIKALIDYDRTHNSDFVPTLKTYLRDFGNITKMSKAMNMHRNTSIYRLQRIEEIMNVSLSDYNTMEQISFSLRIMEYKRIVERGSIPCDPQQIVDI